MRRSYSAAWLAGDPAAHALGPLDWRDEAARRRHLAEHAGRAISPALLASLAAANPDPAQRRSLEALARPGALAVVTGQQVGLFGGPLYALYKALSAIALAEALAAESGRPVVPVFWLQTEDHDLAEIAACEILPRTGDSVRLEIAGEGPARRSIAHRHLGDDVLGVLAALAEALEGLPEAAAAHAACARAYAPGVALGAAFQALLSPLLAPRGLLFLDPRRAELAALAAEVHGQALTEHDALSAALASHGAELRGADLTEQVAPRPGASLSFFHPDGPEGDRFRLERVRSGFRLPGGPPLDPAVLARALEDEPLVFSTSALLRPILQDTLLPTAVTVGGPGELGYFGQVAPLYRAFGLPRPMFALRARLRLLTDAAVARLAQLGLGAADVETDREALLARLCAAQPAPAELPSAVTLAHDWPRGLYMHLSEYEARAGALERGLSEGARRARVTIERALGRLATRHARAVSRRDVVTRERVERLQQLLYPGGAPQERVYAMPGFAARVGPGVLADRVAAAIDPFSAALRELVL